MSSFTRLERKNAGLQRHELITAAVEVGAIFTIFIIAFTGRSAFGDGVRQLLIVLSVIAGSLGAVAGMWVLLRAIQFQTSRVPRLALGSFMTFIGIYTVVHVL
ncbi:hypothetical protein BH23CHL1_BH23CHL1_10540 [soil metagenome]